jgi:hypothetical protein
MKIHVIGAITQSSTLRQGERSELRAMTSQRADAGAGCLLRAFAISSSSAAGREDDGFVSGGEAGGRFDLLYTKSRTRRGAEECQYRK